MNGDHFRITVLFTLIGAVLGVLIAMLFLSSGSVEFGRTNIFVSGPLTLGMAIFGSLIGAFFSHLFSSRPRAHKRLIAVEVIVLTALLGASLGWIVGGVRAKNGEEQKSMSRLGSAIGGLSGAPIGLLVLAPRRFGRSST